MQNHHPSLLSLPVVSCRHKAAPGQTPPLKIRSRVPFLAPYPPFVSYVRRGSMMGESIGRIKRGVLGHRSSSFRRFRCPHACRPLSTVSRGRHRVTLGDIRASVPVHGWWAQFRRVVMPPPPLSLSLHWGLPLTRGRVQSLNISLTSGLPLSTCLPPSLPHSHNCTFANDGRLLLDEQI